MSLMNRLATADNRHQGEYKRVLCVCSAGILRSPTAAVVLSQAPFNFNTRAAGVDEDFALFPVDQVSLHWADEIVCMTRSHKYKLEELMKKYDVDDVSLYCLDIPDTFEYRNPELMKLIAERYKAVTHVQAKS